MNITSIIISTKSIDVSLTKINWSEWTLGDSFSSTKYYDSYNFNDVTWILMENED